ncbi:DNA-binding protein [Bacillus thuringiensis serovar yunnanensis]|nr:DNA-binding protein [Bacillus thuringiensis serovar yunnanensis]
MDREEPYKKTYSLADIARILGRPRTTLQAWRDQFKPYLPTVSGTRGRTLRYEKEALELFRLIADMKDVQEPPEVIERMLKQNIDYIVVVEVEDDDGITKPIIQTMYEGMNKIIIHFEEQKSINMELLKRIDNLEQTNQTLLDKIDEQQKTIDGKINNRDQQLLEVVREIQETKKLVASTQQEKSWFTRLFKK